MLFQLAAIRELGRGTRYIKDELVWEGIIGGKQSP